MTISPLGALAASIRRQIQRSTDGRATGLGVRSRALADPPQSSSGGDDLESVVRRRAAAIDRHDPDRARKALTVFLESIVMLEFGPQVLTDPQFGTLVARIQSAIEQDDEMADLVAGVTRELVA